MRCRAAASADAPGISEILQEAFAEFRPLYTPQGYAVTTPDPDVVRARLSEGPTWVVEEGDAIIATVSAQPQDRGLYIRSMAVRPVARGRGAATLLLAQVETYARALELPRLYLRTTPFLRAATALYQRAGFRFTGEESSLMGTPLLTMEKNLQAPSAAAPIPRT
jgi:GNAT superfamily N-acetyltransferase